MPEDLGEAGRFLPRGWVAQARKKESAESAWASQACHVRLSTFCCNPRGLRPDRRLRERPLLPMGDQGGSKPAC
jgi:hypothetical protein